MTTIDAATAPGGRRGFRSMRNALVSRLAGPGGYYTVGNLIGLVSGLGLQLSIAAGSGLTGTAAITAYFVGSPAAVALTVATMIFLVAGEMYHRAWAGTDVPDTDLNRIADVLSAAGGVGLAVSLAYLDQPVLALLTGLLIVPGKLGSAIYGDNSGALEFWPADWPDLFRSMVLAGRVPAMAAAGLELWHQLGNGTSVQSVLQPAVLLLCHLLWMRADILLFQSNRDVVQPLRT